MIAAIYDRKSTERGAKAGTLGSGLVALLLAGALVACNDSSKRQATAATTSRAQDEVLLSCREAHGPNLTIAIRGGQAILGLNDGSRESATVTTSPESYDIRLRDNQEYRVNRINGQLNLFVLGQPPLLARSQGAPGECKQITKRIGK